jgi:DNA-binding transcriptional ArsR family regulator
MLDRFWIAVYSTILIFSKIVRKVFMPKNDAESKTSPCDKTQDTARHKADILKALAHPDRIRIFEALATGEKTVTQIVELLGAKSAITSRHLAVLRNAGLIAARKQGLNVYYANKMPCLLSIFSCVDQAICDIADEHSLVAAYIRK